MAGSALSGTTSDDPATRAAEIGDFEREVTRVVVAVLTYRRPRQLAQLLVLLLPQAARAQARVLVVDNDPAASAEGVAAPFASSDVAYVHEPLPGIAAARNRALTEAEDADLLVFLDDDERPVEGWLESLLDTYAKHRCAAVVGPVVSTFEQNPSRWVREGRFFDRRRLATGTRVEVAATNNLLLDLRQIRRLGLAFDSRFGISGGSDTLFTRALHRRGGVLVWCDEALVVDVVPAGRVTWRWVLMRAFRSGNGWTRTSLALSDTRRERVGVRVQLALAGSVRIIAGAARCTLGLALGDLGQRARGVRTIARGAGMLAGTWGYVYLEYRRPAKLRTGVGSPAGRE